MSGELVALMLTVASVQSPTEVGSVEGPFAWVDLHGGLGAVEPTFEASSVLSQSAVTRGLAAAQLQAFAGYGLPVLGHHLALSASLYGTLVPAPFSLSGSTQLQPSPLRLGASMPFGLANVAVVPKLGLGLPVNPVAPGQVITFTPALAVRWRPMGLLLLGADAAFALNLLEPRYILDALAPYDPDAVYWGTVEYGRAQVRFQGEYDVAPAISVAARVELVARESPVLMIDSGYSPGNPVGGVVVHSRSYDLRPVVEAHWAFAEHFGLTASAAFSERWYATYNLTLWEGHVSLWFRTDARLRRPWLER